jgi:subtilisin family serine protease
LPGMNFVNQRKPPEDDNQHGTHVTGIIVASNNDIGMVGVAPKAKVIPVKVLDKNGNGSLVNVATGIRWAVDNGADILAMSLGSPRPTQEVRKAIQYAANKGVITFCAAGNAGLTQNVFYPALYPETIAIGAINEELKRATFSNTGKRLDFMAPGDKIFSTVPDNWYAILSGTSMACPFAVGVAALVLSYKRHKKINIKLDTAEDYRNVFKKNTINIQNGLLGDPTFYQGFGIIDPRKLIEAVKAYQIEHNITPDVAT